MIRHLTMQEYDRPDWSGPLYNPHGAGGPALLQCISISQIPLGKYLMQLKIGSAYNLLRPKPLFWGCVVCGDLITPLLDACLYLLNCGLVDCRQVHISRQSLRERLPPQPLNQVPRKLASPRCSATRMRRSVSSPSESPRRRMRPRTS